MRFTRLRIVGFKSFVEPTEFVIEPGMTGIVGPNGCGKSNLTEALRWVMGETSTRNMRAGEMDDVIFAGTTQRPARNSAEVTLYLDNTTRTAPAAFNDSDALEVSRRIERDGGSTYRVNGREVRARDVQLLFADAATGARSPALVRQGQISEIISAKPTARRRLLEDAAGISGLHARRHETELRLKAAEANLARLDDVMAQIGAQLDGLRRQARSAVRYRQLSAAVKEAESLLHHRRFVEARTQVDEAARAVDLAVRTVADTTAAQAATATAQAVAAHELPALREAEARAAAALHRLSVARDALDVEERRVSERIADLERRVAQFAADIDRERAIDTDTDTALARLDAEAVEISAAAARASDDEMAARDHLDGAGRRLDESEHELSAATHSLAEATARRNQTQRSVREADDRLTRAAAQLADVARESEALAARRNSDTAIAPLRDTADAARAALAAAEGAAVEAERAVAEAREAETQGRDRLAQAERTAGRLEAEQATLKNLLARGVAGRWRPVIDEIAVDRGYEAALAAALGDDLDATTDASAPMRWTAPGVHEADPPLPAGVAALAGHVRAPAVLARRLAQIGLVERAAGPETAKTLAPGQRLVSREGDLWRWDGFVANAEAPSAAARRLMEKNRLAEIEANAAAASAALVHERTAFEALRAATRAAQERDQAARLAVRETRGEVTSAQAALAAAEKRAAETDARVAALADTAARLGTARDDAEAALAAAQEAFAACEDPATLEQEVATLRTRVAGDRAALAEARADHQALTREAEARRRRLDSIADERTRWRERKRLAGEHVVTLESRLADARAELDALDGVPGQIREKRLSLLNDVDAAERARSAAADRLADGENRLAEADRAARAALGAMSEAREGAARAEARLEGARERLADVERAAVEALDMAPAAILASLGLPVDADIPSASTLEQKLDSLRKERERLGAVNLRADEEAAEVEAQYERLASEKEDLDEAIRRLRTGIGNLNREARERLTAAFATVSAHFSSLFTTLFGGGTAELTLTESDDPLEAGLDIVAKPPGKKPQSLALLSGGEQALTATALIFAVFMTNPAPICVLDEVDAPLDDHNVERYCDLLDEMTRRTATRFAVITHNPITMARMHRLFGVTMAERGVSQVVSVDLENAERMVQAA